MNFIEQIAIGSPWWKDSNWDKKDRHIVSALKSKIRMRHVEQYQIKFPSIDIIRGPRQIGKTTELKLIIKDLLTDGTNPMAIGYVTCDVISKSQELFEILKSFAQHLSLNRLGKGKLFLDEVSSVRDWQRAVKGFVDLSLGRNVHLAVTGSSSIELKRGYERMPGRRNGGRDYLFLPVDFRKFCLLANPDKNITSVKLTEILSSARCFGKFEEEVSIEAAFFRKHLADYFHIGGFPRSISDYVNDGEISSETLFVYQSVLFSEFEKHKKSIATLMQILGEVAKNISASVSFNTIMKNIELASANTVKEYVETLAMAYLGMQVFCVNISRKKPFNKKDKKNYLIDPVIFRVLQDKLKIAFPPDSAMAENMAAVHLARFFLKEWADVGLLNNLFYWKSAKGNEVDFIIFLNGKPFGIEVKYQNIISQWDEMSIRRGIRRGMVITKDTFKYGEIPKIPLWAFLLLSMQ